MTGAPLHTNFKLSGTGEYLALMRPDSTITSAFSPKFPDQLPNVAYGFLPNITQAIYFVAPTPKKANESTTRLPDPVILPASTNTTTLKSNQTITVSMRIAPVLTTV